VEKNNTLKLTEMKKITLLTIIGILLFSGATFATEFKSKLPGTPAGVWITLHIKFHKPKWDCKRGFGLCFNITFGFEDEAKPNTEAVCRIKMLLNNNQLIMKVREIDLQSYENGSTLPYFSGKSSIMLDEPTEIPASFCRQLGTSGSIVIKPGTYPVTFKDNTYTVVFQL